ncbi:MAG: lysophospholipid acyltransferase family protein [Oscillospiraceae bacterium]|nr:lysophospholipid acyltransferase family protein [Oscillospiraceae bacterium]
MMFDPKTDRFPYPPETDKHYLKVHMDRGIVFDTEYPYIDRSKGFLFRQGVVRFLLNAFVFRIAAIRMGLKIEGRENIRKYKDVLKNGVVSVANHVHMWDYIAVMTAIRPFRSNLLAWAPNVNGENGTLIRMVGGIPIPEGNTAATKTYLKVMRDLLQNRHGWLHIYAEGSMWEYYRPVRPFKRGAAHIACDSDKPILPLGFSYREPGWIRKHIFRQIATFTLHVGEPLFPNKELNAKEREKDLLIRSHEAVCRLVGIDPEENLYPAVFDNSKRIDYYTTTYGVGYRGSH